MEGLLGVCFKCGSDGWKWFCLKDVELRLVAELMKNSRRSDREIAKALKVSQPTVSRMIRKLEREGVIQEYTMIPNFSKLGYEIMTATFVRHSRPLGEAGLAESRKSLAEVHKKHPHGFLITADGEGLQKDMLFITFYESYSAYVQTVQLARNLVHVDLDSLDSFIVDLSKRSNYGLLSMAAISNHILLQAERIGKPSSRKKTVTKSVNTEKSMKRQI